MGAHPSPNPSACRFVNAEGVGVWVKLHWKTESGVKNLTREAAGELCGSDPDHATRDLFEH
ncbi:catalase, partial [archaeon]